MDLDSFQPEKRTLGEILSSTTPPIRVPDYQRDFSWGPNEVSDFWSDLIAFGGNNPRERLIGREYFLGAAVLVNNGSYHLLLDGQQRLATATILLAALRDQMSEYKRDAANQIQEQYIAYEDHLTGERVLKIELNVFDRGFFRDVIQAFPRVPDVVPTKKSHSLINGAYKFFARKITEGWKGAGDGKKGFDWAAHIALTLREHIALVTVISNNERNAASIFSTLNDRGIGLSAVDLIRSWVLQRAHESKREEILQCWDEIFTACGNASSAEAAVRISWVSRHGDVKTRALYKVITNSLTDDTAALGYSRRLRQDAKFYKQFRDGDTDDPELERLWLGLSALSFHAGYPLLLAAYHKLTPEEQKNLARAMVALVVRHNIVCKLDRGHLESISYRVAQKISEGSGYEGALAALRGASPQDTQFDTSFGALSFPPSSPVARYVLHALEAQMMRSQEVIVAGPSRVHLEHIYPLSPPDHERWPDHDRYVSRLGNLTLLDRRLNEKIKNSCFTVKKQQAYEESRLEITKGLLQYTDWSHKQVVKRQTELRHLARIVWPYALV
jgi:hypothetical protein